MIFFVVVLMAAAASAAQVNVNVGIQASFDAKCDGVNGHLSNLDTSFSKIKAIAQARGQATIVAKCDEAQEHLSQATSSFGVLAKTFATVPWDARGSTHSTEVRYRLSLCGNILGWISSLPEVQSFKGYAAPLSSCQNTYVGCQTSCGQIWSWPAPPTKSTPHQKPKPSQAHGGYARRSLPHVAKVCPPFEDACPVGSGSGGLECLDLQNEVASCGGCVSIHRGENCLEIPGADGVGCLDGHCIVLSVLDGYSLNKTGRPVKV